MRSQPKSFTDDLAFSRETGGVAHLEAILLAEIPGARQVIQACKESDQAGVDLWVEIGPAGQLIGVDVKRRRDDFLATKGYDDLALETWNVKEIGIVGWTRDESKRCDYILWLWPTGRWALVPFRQLLAVMQEHWQSWRDRYGIKIQETDYQGKRYHSEHIYVPRREVWAEIYKRFSGYPVPEGDKK